MKDSAFLEQHVEDVDEYEDEKNAQATGERPAKRSRKDGKHISMTWSQSSADTWI